jgi:hypothetical protein
MGLWGKEFGGKDGRPHLHMYVAVPELVTAEEYVGLRERTLLSARLVRVHGKHAGRGMTPAIGMDYGGEFAMWLRNAWSEVVGTQGVDKNHHARGVDVRVSFWNDEEAVHKDRVAVALYMAGESGKWSQKTPPAEFEGIGNYYGVMGRCVGFVAQETEVLLSAEVFAEVERRLERWVRVKLIALSRRSRERVWSASAASNPRERVWEGEFRRRRAGDGVRALGLRGDQWPRLLGFAMAAAERKGWDAGGRERGVGVLGVRVCHGETGRPGEAGW